MKPYKALNHLLDPIIAEDSGYVPSIPDASERIQMNVACPAHKPVDPWPNKNIYKPVINYSSEIFIMDPTELCTVQVAEDMWTAALLVPGLHISCLGIEAGLYREAATCFNLPAKP